MTNTTTSLQKALNGLWTVNDLCRRTNKTPMTIHLWRERRRLPTIVIQGSRRPSIRFVPDDVRRWARANNVKLEK